MTAVLASLAVAGTASAASWSPQVHLSSNDGSSVDVATINSTTAVAAYEESDEFGDSTGLFRRRSTDGGQTWGAPLMVAPNGGFPALAANGMDVDLVWNNPVGRVRYAHSTDGGVTFGPAISLSPSGRFAWRPAVARGPGGIVAVIYEDVVNGNVAVRISTNGGNTFGPADIVTENGDEMGLAVAVGDGVIYAAYSVGFENLRLRRTLDNGATWSAQQLVTNDAWIDGISMTAQGTHAYVAYTVSNDFPEFGQAVYRRTLNSGEGWGPRLVLGPADWSTSDPDIGMAGGVLHAVFTRCTPEFDICPDERIFHRRSTTGTSWTTPSRVSPTSMFDAFSPAVGWHRAVVTYIGFSSTADGAFARTRIP